MKKNELYIFEDSIIRIIALEDDSAMILDCNAKKMPYWVNQDELSSYTIASEDLLDFCEIPEEEIEPKKKQIMYKRYSYIAGAVALVDDVKLRTEAIKRSCEQNNVTEHTIRSYLIKYLKYQSIQALLPAERKVRIELSDDEKNMRWALNKFFYNSMKNSLNTAFVMMLKEKYCINGELMAEHPTFNQFRYFYRKTKSKQNYLISRNGLSNYQRNDRPCLGEVQQYAVAPGYAMIDGTVCDIYLTNDSGELVSRPNMVALVDGYSGYCLGYYVGWATGLEAIRELMCNVLKDTGELPLFITCDRGKEYIGSTFENLTALNIQVECLPGYRPELKGVVEKFFDVTQGQYKKVLKGKGVVEDDFQERGCRNYLKDACITLSDFRDIVRTIVDYYNKEHLLTSYPLNERQMQLGIKPYAEQILKYGKEYVGNNFVKVSQEQLVLTLLPRTEGRIDRFGLHVNRMRYKGDVKADKYLNGGKVVCAYDPDSCNHVWIVQGESYTRFELIESSRYKDKSIEDVNELINRRKEINKEEYENHLQAQISLVKQIETIAQRASKPEYISTNNLKANREKELAKTHTNFVRKVGLDE